MERLVYFVIEVLFLATKREWSGGRHTQAHFVIDKILREATFLLAMREVSVVIMLAKANISASAPGCLALHACRLHHVLWAAGKKTVAWPGKYVCDWRHEL